MVYTCLAVVFDGLRHGSGVQLGQCTKRRRVEDQGGLKFDDLNALCAI